MDTEQRENPFISDAKKRLEEEEKKATRGRPGRKPMTPNFDQVLRAVERGDYDYDLHELTAAIRTRNDARREHVLRLVTEVFGDDAVIEYTKGDPGNNFEVTRSRMGITPEADFSMENNAFRKDDTASMPTPGADSEPEVDSETETITPDPLAHLDEVEQRMVQEPQEGAPVPAGTTVVEAPVPIEQRGAKINGLGASDMGD